MTHKRCIEIVREQYERVTGKPPYIVDPTIKDGHIVSVFVCEEPDEHGLARYADISTDSRFPEYNVRHDVEVYVDHMIPRGTSK